MAVRGRGKTRLALKDFACWSTNGGAIRRSASPSYGWRNPWSAYAAELTTENRIASQGWSGFLLGFLTSEECPLRGGLGPENYFVRFEIKSFERAPSVRSASPLADICKTGGFEIAILSTYVYGTATCAFCFWTFFFFCRGGEPMKLSFCEWCGGEMITHVEVQRFCTRDCSDAFYQAERQAAVEYFRACGLKPPTQANNQQAERRDERRVARA